MQNIEKSRDVLTKRHVSSSGILPLHCQEVLVDFTIRNAKRINVNNYWQSSKNKKMTQSHGSHGLVTKT